MTAAAKELAPDAFEQSVLSLMDAMGIAMDGIDVAVAATALMNCLTYAAEMGTSELRAVILATLPDVIAVVEAMDAQKH